MHSTHPFLTRPNLISATTRARSTPSCVSVCNSVDSLHNITQFLVTEENSQQSATMMLATPHGFHDNGTGVSWYLQFYSALATFISVF